MTQKYVVPAQALLMMIVVIAIIWLFMGVEIFILIQLYIVEKVFRRTFRKKGKVPSISPTSYSISYG